MAKKAGKERLVKACQMGIEMKTYNYGFISRIISNGTDKLWMENDSKKMESQLPEHENLRGEDYYKKLSNE